MDKKIKKVVAIVVSGFVALKLTEAFQPELILKLNEASKYASFLNPNILLNLIGYSLGDFLLDIFKAAILALSAWRIWKIIKEDE